MKIHELIQGSPEWVAFRFEHFGASEAAAMLGLSTKMTRTELMHMKHTGNAREFSNYVQERILDEGHRVEAAARPIMAKRIGEKLYAVTCSNEDVGGKLSASCDGLTMDESKGWEHKQWNQSLAESVAAGELPDEYMPQPQQCMLVTGASEWVFTVSDGAEENMVSMVVKADPVWFDRIVKGWAQFERDKADYVPAAIEVKPVGATPETLPALFVELTGAVTASNLDAYKEHALAVIGAINRDIQTDQDFANAAKAVKWCGDVESRLEAVKQHALSQTESIDLLFKTIDDIKAKARETRLDLDKLVTRRNTERKDEIILGGKTAYQNHLASLKTETEGLWVELPTPDFAGAVKGMRLLANMQDAVNTLLANSKISADDSAKKIRANLALLAESKEHAFLFNDRANLVAKAPDDLKLLINSRIDAHKAAEAAKEEATRARIRVEEQEKAEREARAKLAAEQAEAVAVELAAAKASEGAELSPAAQALYESEGAANFAKAHPKVTYEVVAKIMMPPAVRQAMAPVVSQPFTTIAVVSQKPADIEDNGIRLKLGQINERLAPINLTADGLAEIGFPHVATDKSAKLYRECDFPAICNALIAHISEVQDQFEPVAA